MWIDANAPYHDRFVNKRPGTPAYDPATDQELLAKLGAVHQRRCASCHPPGEITRLDWLDLRQPAASLFLRAPLRKEAGGAGRCSNAVYQATSDPDYQAVLQLATAAAKKALDYPRRDLQAFNAPITPPTNLANPTPRRPEVRGH
jgi:hypothetical protein